MQELSVIITFQMSYCGTVGIACTVGLETGIATASAHHPTLISTSHLCTLGRILANLISPLASSSLSRAWTPARLT
jgi:hypothetical protein